MSKILQLLLWLLSIYLINSLQSNEETALLYNETYVKEKSGDQLTDETIPLSYELKMVPDLESFSFIGGVRITILIKSSTNFVILNEKGLNIISCQVLLDEALIQSMYYSNYTEQLLVIKTFQNLIPNTTYFLDIEFQGQLNTEPTGFYQTSYMINNDTYWLATTQFEETYAREAFPCFDEIRFKTPYTIYLAHFPDQKAISNMPIEEKLLINTDVGDRIWTKFQTSPPMPTYLVAFMVSDFSSISSVGEDIQITVWTRKNVIEYTSYALKQSINYMKYFEEYTNIQFILPKLDVIAVPNFNHAMENWGMTTYGENYIIVDEQISSERHKFEVKTTLCHEIVHQWFGNLVTPDSWRTYWLKEGFATYFQYFADATEQTKWNMDHFFVIDVLQQALKEESQNPKAMTVMLTEKIPVSMDYAGYDKAASIIRMFEHVISSSSLKVMLQNFLRKGAGRHKGTVTTANLFEEFDILLNNEIPYLSEEISFSQILKIWSENVGFPLVSVTQNYSTQTIKVQHATYEGIEQDINITPNQKWIIPLTYTTKSQLKFFNTKPMLWSYTNITTELPGITNPDDWILFNLQQTGYYRVNYDLRNWQLLINQLYEDPMKIHVLNRAQLIDDSIELAADGKLIYDITFSLLQYLTKEIEMAPWHTAISSLQALYQKYEGTSLREYFKEFSQQIMEPAYKNFGFKIKATDSHIEKIVKPELLYFACDVRIEGCIREALKEYIKNENDPRKVNPDLKPVVFCTALRYHDDQHKVFNTLWSMYLATPILSEKVTIASTMKCIENVEVIKKLLSKFKDIKNHDPSIQRELNEVFSSQSFTEVTIQKLNEQISTISESNDDGSMYLLRHLVIKSEKQLHLLNEFISQLQSLDRRKYSHLTITAQDKYRKGKEKLIVTEKKSNVLKSVLCTILKKSKKFDSSDGVSISSISFKWVHLMLTIALFIFTTNNNL